VSLTMRTISETMDMHSEIRSGFLMPPLGQDLTVLSAPGGGIL